MAVPRLNRWLGRDLRAAALAAALLPLACGGEGGEEAPRRSPDPVRGAALVVGSTAGSWGLLVVPWAGGRPELRALDDPSRTIWNGRTSLPPSVEAHALEGGVVVLLTEGGTVERYDAAVDAVAAVGRVGGGATWERFGGVGAWLEADRRSALLVSATDAWRVSLPEDARWVAPVGLGSLAAILGTAEEGRAVVLASREETSDGSAEDGAGPGPDARGDPPLPLRPPAAVTAFGRRLAAVGADGRRLVLLSLPELETLGEVEFEGSVRSLAASPSTHEIYVAVGEAPARLVAFDRLAGRTRVWAEIEGPVAWIRPAVLGGHLLVGGRERAWLVPLGGGEAVALPGRPRADLPVGLPGERALVRTDAGVAEWFRDAGGEGRLSPARGPGEAWWLPVRWRPPSPERVAAADGPAESGSVEDPGAAEGPEAGERLADAAARPAGSPGAADAAAPGTPSPPPEEAVRLDHLEPGFYAIVSSSQRREAIAALVGGLSEAGFRAAVQRHRDEAGEVWFRAMVGPYETREGAEAAARQLRRERGLQAWISEVGPDVRPEDLSS